MAQVPELELVAHPRGIVPPNGVDDNLQVAVQLLTDDFQPTQPLASQKRSWRTEVKNGGKYWQWRKGSHQNRLSRYGGKFEQLSTKRKAAYHQNKAR